MKAYILLLAIAFAINTNANYSFNSIIEQTKDRKLTNEEVEQRGINLKVNDVIRNLKKGDIRSYARSPIYETVNGFKWKLINVKTGKSIAIEVNKDFKIISRSK